MPGISLQHPLPVRPTLGIRYTANTPTPTDDRWTNGATVLDPIVCRSGSVTDPCNVAALVPTTTPQVERHVTPFLVRVADYCSAIATDKPDPSRALARWDAEADRLIEQELTYGAAKTAAGWTNKFLNDSNKTNLGSIATPLAAFAAIEDYLGSCDFEGDGIIYMSRLMATKLLGILGLHREGHLMLTGLGTRVNVSRDQTDDNKIFASGPLLLYVSQPEVLDYVRRSDNTNLTIVGGYALYDWQCCQAVVTVT